MSKIKRVKHDVNTKLILDLRDGGLSYRDIALETGYSVSMCVRVVRGTRGDATAAQRAIIAQETEHR